MASSLFQAPPNGTFEGALVHFLTAEKYRGDDNPWKDNKLFVAKCHVQLNNLPEAIKWLDLAAAVPSKSADVIIIFDPPIQPNNESFLQDEESEKQVQTLLSKYHGYRRT